MRFSRAYPLFGIVLSCLLILGLYVSPGLSQSRRLPPTSNEKKNKRPGETPSKEGDQEPLPKDLDPTPPKDKDIEKVAISTQIVNVDAVVYHKKSGQIVANLKKPNFAIFDNGVQQEITNFSTPEAPIIFNLCASCHRPGEAAGSGGHQDPQRPLPRTGQAVRRGDGRNAQLLA